MKISKTYSARPVDITRTWYIVDADSTTLGRLATVIATYLQGKHKPGFTAHIDSGDSVVVVNAAQVRTTGDKLRQKRYYRYSGFPGGLRSRTLEQQLEERPETVIEKAVSGMLPANKLKSERLKRLKVYAGAEHPHAPQQPQPLEIK